MSLARRIEIGALIALAFFLPLYEAPKTIAWFIFVVAWLANRARSRDFGGRWDHWDTLIALWIASGFVVAAFAGLHRDEWRGALDPLRYGAVLWLLKRSHYSSGERMAVFYSLIASVLVGLAIGFWRLQAGEAQYIELNSVGHVNHTAIYLAILLGACAAWSFCGGGPVAAGMTVLLLVSLVVTTSRGSLGVALAMLVILAASWWPRSPRPAIAAALLIAATVATAWFSGAEVIQKHEEDIQKQNMLAFRDGIWRAALVAWERYPAFGIGVDNYKLITQERLKAWRAESGKDFDPARYAEFPHAHSLYLTALAERGLVGSAPLLALLAAWLVALLRHRPARDAPQDEWLWWASAASAFLITTGVGFVNTTLHHEHGILAAMFLGLWLSTSSGRSSTPP